MRHLRKFTGIIFVFVVVFMIASVFSHHSEEGDAPVQGHFGYGLSEGWTLTSPDGSVQEEIDLPYAVTLTESDMIVFQNTIPQELSGMTLTFSCENADVRVFLDGEELERQTADTDADSEQYVTIPEAGQEAEAWGELCMELTAVNADSEAVFEEAIIGAGDTMVVGLVGNNLADIACCLLIVISAVILFVLAVIRWYTNQPSQGGLFLGLFGLTAGVYCFIGTDTMNLFFDMQGIHVLQEYLMLMLPLFLALYFEKNLGHMFPRRFGGLLFIVSCNAVVQIVLELLGVRDLLAMADVSAAMLGLVCVVAIVSLIQLGGKSRGRQILLPILAVLVLLAGEVAEVILNYFSLYAYARVATLYGMALFGLLLAILHILHISREYRRDAEEKVKETEKQNRQLAQAKREAFAANEAKGKFLAQMSHEIRTPINVILGMDEMILRESTEPNVREYAMDIHTAGQSLLSLINDILDFSKIDSGKMEIVPVNYEVSSMIHDLVNMTLQRAIDKGLRLEVEVDPDIPSRLFGDDVRIRQVLINILTNAVKYTEKGTIWLRVRNHVSEGKAALRFEVEDTGIGIKEEDLPKLSAEFERIEENRNRNIEGTGLGMSITIRLLKLLNSALHVESRYGEGSKFSFELEQKIMDETPIGDFGSKVKQMAENYTYESALYAPDAKILVVDDNATNRKVLRNLLKETKIQVTEAGGGEECLSLVQENRYDLIFLDHMMPGMDGVETLHHMKALPEFPNKDTPVVVLTANAVSGAKEAYLEEGFDDFLSKPVVPDKLEGMILQMLPKELLQKAGKAERKPSAKVPAAEFQLEELPVVEGLDWNYAWLHLPDPELLAYTVREFYEQIEPAADALERAYGGIADAAYLEQYRIQVHAMKSLAATIGIIALSGMAMVLEAAARAGNTDTITSMTDVFLAEWRSYLQKLQGVFDIEAGAEKEVTDYSVMQALVEMVRISMQEMDIDRADECMKQLREFDFPEEIRQNMQKLAEAVTNLDAEESERLADLLCGQMAGQRVE